jgi:hypothetical protein
MQQNYTYLTILFFRNKKTKFEASAKEYVSTAVFPLSITISSTALRLFPLLSGLGSAFQPHSAKSAKSSKSAKSGSNKNPQNPGAIKSNESD